MNLISLSQTVIEERKSSRMRRRFLPDIAPEHTKPNTFRHHLEAAKRPLSPYEHQSTNQPKAIKKKIMSEMLWIQCNVKR